MSTETLAGCTPRNGDEGPISDNGSGGSIRAAYAADADDPDDPGVVECRNCGIITRNGWELALIAVDECPGLEFDGWNVLLCKDCKDKHHRPARGEADEE